MRIELEKAVVLQRACDVEVRPSLGADRCDGCGRIFTMREFCGEKGRGVLAGTFEHAAIDPTDGRIIGNSFLADVCSLRCAHRLFAEGGWRDIPRYRPFADKDIRLGRAEVVVTAYVMDEAEIRRERAAEEVRRPPPPRMLRLSGEG